MLDRSGTADEPTSAAMPVSVSPVPMVPSSVAVPVVRLIVNSCEAPPVGDVSEAKATPLVPEMSKPTRSEVLKPRPLPIVVSTPPLGDGVPFGPPCMTRTSRLESMPKSVVTAAPLALFV